MQQLGENGSELWFLRPPAWAERSRVPGLGAVLRVQQVVNCGCPAGLGQFTGRPASPFQARNQTRAPARSRRGRCQQSAGPARPGLKDGAGPSRLPSNPRARVTAGSAPRGLPSSSPLLRRLQGVGPRGGRLWSGRSAVGEAAQARGGGATALPEPVRGGGKLSRVEELNSAERRRCPGSARVSC